MNQKEIEELKRKYYALDDEIRSLDVSQSSYKVAANSFYGVTGLQHFRYYDPRLAEAVTSTGQVFIKRTKKYIDMLMNKIMKTENVDYVFYCDTDSVVGDTIVHINGTDMKISDAYDLCGEVYEKRDDYNRSYVKPTKDMKTLSFDTACESVVSGNVKYIMKHKVNKRMFKLTVGDKSVTVTEDHSIIVYRNSEYVSVSPKDLLSTDKIVKIKNE